MFYQAPTRHWENDSHVYWVHQFCTICAQAVYPFPHFWRLCEVSFLLRKGKTKRLCICLWFKPLMQLVLCTSSSFSADPVHFWSLVFSLVLWCLLLSPFFTACLAKEQWTQYICRHSSNSEDLQNKEGLQRISSVYYFKHCYCSEKMLQVTKWCLLLLRDVVKAFWLILSVP